MAKIGKKKVEEVLQQLESEEHEAKKQDEEVEQFARTAEQTARRVFRRAKS